MMVYLKTDEEIELIRESSLLVSKTLAEVANHTGFDSDVLKKQWEKFELLKAFGFILEEMAIYVMLDTILANEEIFKRVATLYSSVKVNFYGSTGGNPIDEFDILLLTKTGQLINFECKSGAMSGDNAKSNSYSTYAVAGVYSLPILVTPILSQEKKDNNFFNDNVKSAIISADKANLDIWCIDEISDKLKEKFK